MNALIKENPLITRLAAIFFSLALAISMVPITAIQASADDVMITPQEGGVWGDCTWTLDDGVLTIQPSDAGATAPEGAVPWIDSKASIERIIFAEYNGNKVVGPYNCSGLFQDYPNLISIDFAGFNAPVNYPDSASMFDSDSIWTLDGAAYLPEQIVDAVNMTHGVFVKQQDGPNIIDHVNLSANSFTYDGKEKKPDVLVYASADDSILLKENVHYKITLPDDMYNVSRFNNELDTAVEPKTIIINGIKAYSDESNEKREYYTIEPAEILSVELSSYEFPYDAHEHIPTITRVSSTTRDLNIGGNSREYSTQWPKDSQDPSINPTNVGEYNVTVTGKGNFKGSKPATYRIIENNDIKIDISRITLGESGFIYTGESQIPTIKDDEKTLELDMDYTVSVYDSNNNQDSTNVGWKTMHIVGKGDYEGSSTTRTYQISALDITKDESPNLETRITLSQDRFVEDDEKHVPTVTKVEVWGFSNAGAEVPYKTLTPNVDYTVQPSAQTITHGEYSITIEGQGNYTGTRSTSYHIDPAGTVYTPIDSLELVQKEEFFYNGKEQKPTIIVKAGDTTLTEGDDYTVFITNEDGEQDAISAGTKIVKVTGKGSYTGEKTKTYEIKKAPVIPDDPDPVTPDDPDDPNHPDDPDDPDTPNPPDEPKPDEPSTPDEPKQDEPKPDEPSTPDEPKQDEPSTPDEPNQDEPKQDDPSPEQPAQEETITMYRLYNPNNGEHFYTANQEEYELLADIGWIDEGIGWIAPAAGDPVYRLYNVAAGEHHYTRSLHEKNTLADLGWTDEGVGWYSDKSMGAPLYRLYNPNQYANNHHYTLSKYEHDILVGLGWQDELVSWWGVSAE